MKNKKAKKLIAICLTSIMMLGFGIGFGAQNALADWTTGKFDSAMDFNGTSDFIFAGDIEENVKTILFWIKADSIVDAKILDLDAGTHYIKVLSGTLSAPGFADPANPIIYVDGVVGTTIDTNWHFVAITTTTAIDANSVYLGRVFITPDNFYFNGVLDDVRFYDRVLTALEVAEHYRQRSPSLAQGGTVSGDVYIMNSGKLGIGTSAPEAKLHSISTTEQMRLGYDISNYSSYTINDTGDLTITSSGGDISFGDENISTTGTADFGATTATSLDASSGGITQAGAISGVGNLTFSGSPIVTINDDGSMTWKDSAGSPNTLMTLTDGGTTGNLNITGTLTVSGGTIDVSGAATDFEIIDNTASAFKISQLTNDYFNITTDDADTTFLIDLPVAGSSTTTANLFSGNVVKTINIGTGTAIDTINIGTDATSADVISIGSSGAGNLTLSSAADIDFKAGSTSVLTVQDADRLKMRDATLFTIGDINEAIIDDMEEVVSDWSVDPVGQTTVALEETVVKVNDGAMKITTTSSGNSEGDVVKRTFASNQNYSVNDRIGFWVQATATGQIFTIKISDTVAADSTHAVTIDTANRWHYEEWDISGITSESRDIVDYIEFYIDEDEDAPTIYIDQLRYYDKDNRAGEIFVDGDGHLVLAGEEGIELQANITSSLPGLRIDAAIVEVNQPFAVNVAGDTGINYDLTFLNTGTTFITSAGPLVIAAGDPNHSENLTITTGGSGDVIVDIADSTFGFKVLGVQGGYVFRILPSGDLDIHSVASNLNTPFGGFGKYQNLLTYSEEFDNVAWTSNDLDAVGVNSVVSPDGQTTADTLTSNANDGDIEQDYNTNADVTDRNFIFSVWLKSALAVTSRLKIISSDNGINDGTTLVSETRSVTTEWQRFYVKGTFGTVAAADEYVKAQIVPVDGSTGAVYAWGAQLEEASDAGVYAYTTDTEVTAGRGLLAKGLKLSGDLTATGDVITGDDFKKNCATGYVWVPGSAKYGTMPGFCVMKYEAKCDSDSDGACVLADNKPTSREDYRPWTTISQESARDECQSLGDGYHLMSDPEWMTLAEDILFVADNWTGAAVGSGVLKRGNVGDAAAGNYNGNNPDYGTEAERIGRDANATFAKLKLSTGEYIWDVSGNVWEWTDKVIYEDETDGGTDGSDAYGCTAEMPDTAESETYVYKSTIAIEDPTAADDSFFEELADNVTFTSIYCKTLVGTATLNVQIEGSDINDGNIVCTIDGVLDESLVADISGAVGEELKLAIASVGAAPAPTYLMVQVNGISVAGETAAGWEEYTSIVDFKGLDIVPPNSDTDGAGDTIDYNAWNSADGIGKIYITPGHAYDGNYSSAYHAFIRGGNWSNTSDAGVFALYLADSPAHSTGTGIGFRCSR